MSTDRIMRQFLFWGMWLIIPLLWEICIGFLSAAAVLFKRKAKELMLPEYLPRVTVIVPVYNSQRTLEACLNSIFRQTYPKDSLEVILIDNGSSDESYKVFVSFQESHPEMRLWWYQSEQGKSRALNKGIFASTGKYIVNIDSDGYLDKNAIQNVVAKFESDRDIVCMTGVIYTDYRAILKTGYIFMRIFQCCEFFEYTESFFVGRNFQSLFNTMYTMAGAFSCFRREAMIRTGMYNPETIGEDTHMTFQIRRAGKGKIVLCENAFLFVEPIESLDRLYIQRQRWQRAEIEVARLFTNMHLGGLKTFITMPSMRQLVSDHTLTFPRLIWFFAIIYLYFINYPLQLIIGSNLLLYAAYVLLGFNYIFVSLICLKGQKEIKEFIVRRWYICLIMPLYRFVVYWIRLAGIINSITTETRWNAKTLNEEIHIVRREIRTTKTKLKILEKINKLLNKG